MLESSAECPATPNLSQESANNTEADNPPIAAIHGSTFYERQQGLFREMTMFPNGVTVLFFFNASIT
jgi:hypothetical protein